MALVLADRVRDTTTTTGTGTVTLSGTAPAGYQTFGAAIGNANTTYYTISGGSEWEVGIGTYTAAGTTLSRDTVLASSAGGTTKVTFSAGTKDVFVTYPAEKSVNYDASGNVGIGTTNPSTRLTVVGHNEFSLGLTAQVASTQTSVLSHPVALLNNTDPTVGNGLNVRYQIADTGSVLRNVGSVGMVSTAKDASSVTADMYFYVGASERMRITSGGNLGLGTSSPTAGAGYTSLSLRNATNGGNIDLGVSSTIYGQWLATATASRLLASNGAYQTFEVSGAEAVRIDTSGNLGIGTAAPNVKLEVAGSIRSSSGSTNYLNLSHDGTNGSLSTSTGSFLVYAQGANNIILHTNGTERARITSGGSLLVGKSSVSGLNEVLGVNRASDGHTAMFGRNGGSQNPYMRFFVTDSGCISSIDANGSAGLPALALGANSVEIVRLTSGRMGVGQNAPGTTLDVNGASCQNVVAVSASAVDCSAGNYFTKTASGALTWTFTNVPTSRSFIFALQLANGGSGTQTWPAAVVWDGGTAPTLQASGTDILVFITSDSGTTWRGVRGWKQA